MIEAMKAIKMVYANTTKHDWPDDIWDAICQAIEAEKQEVSQEPVAWQVHPFDYGIGHEGVYARTDRLEQVEAWKRKGWNVQPLYPHPQPKREPLTEETRNWIVATCPTPRHIIDAVERMHDIKGKA
jgi:hypothetical protein